MSRRRIRSFVLAALALAGGVAPLVVTAPPAHAAVLFGLDCGIEGVMFGNEASGGYEIHGIGSAGPYDTPGTNAQIACVLRNGSPTGPIATSWVVHGSGSTVLPHERVLDLRVPTIGEHGETYLCSRVSWQTVNGMQTLSGCERAEVVWFNPNSGEPYDYTLLAKPQDTDLDSNWP